MKTIGELIADLVRTNIKIWHEDTKIRKGENLTHEERANYGMNGRVLNKIRSDLKYKINEYFGDNQYDDRKVNYTKE